MGRRATVVAVAVFLGTSAAWAQNPAPSTSESPYTDSLYATNQHMGFSIRTTVIRWLGGVDVARERDAKASAKEGWWGEPVVQVAPELTQAPKSQR